MGRKSEFSREEKIAAVQLTTNGGRTVLSVANEYGVHENTVMKWKRQYKTNPDLAFSGQNGETPPDEAERLKRRIRELENEVEFLKKHSCRTASQRRNENPARRSMRCRQRSPHTCHARSLKKRIEAAA